jgi:hypothetical protein
MKNVLLLGGPAAGQRVEVHGTINNTHVADTLYHITPMCSHGEVHWFGVLDKGADPLALLIAGYGAAPAQFDPALIEIAGYHDTRACDHLAKTGSFGYFDEPWAVQQARERLHHLGYEP